MSTFSEPVGQGWVQIGELVLAFVLSAIIGLEREFRQKNAGLRTYTLVGFASALIILISKYGFTDIVATDRIVVDPSRIAAQIVSGIGFIGGGVIFVRQDVVRGLTTASIIWLTTAVGMACGAGLPILAVVVTAGHFVVMFAFPELVKRLPRSRWIPSLIRVSYADGRGLLRDILVACTREGLTVNRVRVDKDPRAGAFDAGDAERLVTVALDVRGSRSLDRVMVQLGELPGVVSVSRGDLQEPSEGT